MKLEEQKYVKRQKQKPPNIRGRSLYDLCNIYNNGVLDMVRDIKDPVEGCRNKQQVLSPNRVLAFTSAIKCDRTIMFICVQHAQLNTAGLQLQWGLKWG